MILKQVSNKKSHSKDIGTYHQIASAKAGTQMFRGKIKNFNL